MSQTDIFEAVVEHYDRVAERFAELSDRSPYNEFCERPAMFELAGNVAGMSVLDAGCGAGRYSEWLLSSGAEVMAIDASSAMIELAQSRLGEAATIRLADIGQPLDFIDNQNFDLIISPLGTGIK